MILWLCGLWVLVSRKKAFHTYAFHKIISGELSFRLPPILHRNTHRCWSQFRKLLENIARITWSGNQKFFVWKSIISSNYDFSLFYAARVFEVKRQQLGDIMVVNSLRQEAEYKRISSTKVGAYWPVAGGKVVWTTTVIVYVPNCQKFLFNLVSPRYLVISRTKLSASRRTIFSTKMTSRLWLRHITSA